MHDALPPCDLQLENCHLLNCLEGRNMGAYEQKLHEDVFFYEASKWIVRGLKAGAEMGEAVSLINLETHMKEASCPEGYINTAMDALLSSRSHEMFGHPVEAELNRLYQRRLLFDGLNRSALALRDAGEDIDLIAQRAAAAIEGYHAANKAKTTYSMKEVCGDVARELMSTEEREKGFTTGLASLDRDSGGFRRKMVCVFLAQSHWGKTSFVCMNALSNARKGVNVLVCTGEDTAEMFARNLIVQNSSLTRYEIENNGSHPDVSGSLISSASGIPENITLMETHGLTPAQIASKVTAVIQEKGIDLAYFDYLKVMSQRSKSEEERHQLNDIYEQLAFVIRKQNIAGVVFSQITEPSEKTRDLKMLIRGSKDVAHRADVVLVGVKDRQDKRQIVLSKCKGGYVAAGDSARYYPHSDTRRMLFEDEESANQFGAMGWEG